MMQAADQSVLEHAAEPQDADDRMSPAVIIDGLRRLDTPQRIEILGKILDLYLEFNDRPDIKLVGLFDAMVAALSEKLDRREMIALSQRLVGMSGELPAATRRLAKEDDIAISGPMIEKSETLTDDDLFEIARKGESHLVAMSRRKTLSIVVTDLLIGRAPAKAILQIAANPEAQFSEVGFVNLIQKAKRDNVLARALAARSDIPTELKPFVDMLLPPPPAPAPAPTS